MADLPRTADFVVIGGGILGLAVARELLGRHPDASLCLLEREDRLGITELFSHFRSSFGELYEQLVLRVLELDPNLRFVTEENQKQIAVQINKLEEKARQQHRKNCEVAIKQFERLKAQLQPAGGLQERQMSILPFVAKYGPDLVRRLVAETDLEEGWVHRVVYLGS